MIPRVAIRGHSFKGAGAYYLHDKKADTSERVGWTYTHNLPTQDAEKAMKVMAFTAMHSDQLKRNSGIKLTGRKSKLGEVYSFALGWNPEQKPNKDEMLQSSFETLDKLGLSEHQAVMVYHQETDHPHVHVICNLVNPNTGKMAKVYNDYLVLSEWAEKKEKEDGKVYCEERVINNKIRNGIEPEPTELSKRDQKRAEKKRRKELVQELYSHSDSGKAFSSALALNDLTLAQGDRRGFVIVDKNGDIHSVSRMLKGISNAEMKQRLNDLDLLPNAKEVSDLRKYFDRDQYEIDRQKEIVDNAIEESKSTKFNKTATPKNKPESSEDDKILREQLLSNFENEKSLRLLNYEREHQGKILKAKERFEKAIKLEKSKSELSSLQAKLTKTKGLFSRSKRKEIEIRIEQVKQQIKDSQVRISEQLGSVQRKYDEDKAKFIKDHLKFDVDKRLAEIKKWQEDRKENVNNSEKDNSNYNAPEPEI